MADERQSCKILKTTTFYQPHCSAMDKQSYVQ